MPDRRQIAIFGGSFDPPHIGHTLATAWALSCVAIDEIWWVPAYRHAFGKALSPFDRRFELCSLAIEPFRRVTVSRIEADLGGESRTIDTLEALEARHGDVDFSLLIGSDLLADLPRFKRADELVARYPVHVVGREGGEASFAPMIPNAASSWIRGLLDAGDATALERWMDRGVLHRVAQRDVPGPGRSSD